MLLNDPEATASGISVWHPRRAIVRHTLADYRASLVDHLFRDILKARLEDASERPGSPILDADVDVRVLQQRNTRTVKRRTDLHHTGQRKQVRYA